MNHAHALARLPESHNYTSTRRVNSVPAAAAGGRDSSTPSLSGPAIAASCIICIGACVCVCARVARTDSDIPGSDPNLFWAATCLEATGARLTRRSLLIPRCVKLEGRRERGMTGGEGG